MQVARAYVSDFDHETMTTSCYYSGSAYDDSYDTIVRTDSACADLLWIDGYFFYNSTLIIHCYTDLGSGWNAVSPNQCGAGGGPINNVYGYHQAVDQSIMSNGFETHAQ